MQMNGEEAKMMEARSEKVPVDGKSGKLFPQLVVGFGVMMIVVQLGISSGWSSPYLAQLTGPDSELPLSMEQASWVASLLNLGRLVGAFAGAVAANYLGSKKTMLLILTPMSICWIMKMLAASALWLYAARFCAGLALGVMYSSFPLYLGEVALPEIRGALVSLASAGATFGLTLGTICNSYLSMQISAAIYLIPCLVLMALFMWLPESPHHLLKVNQPEKARRSIEWYRSGCGVDEELRIVSVFISNAKSQTFHDKLKDLCKPALMRATILIIALWIFMQICGYNIILAYMEMTLIQGSFTIIEPKIAVMYISASAILASMLSIYMIEKCGRRVLLIISGLGASVGMSGLGMHFYFLEQGGQSSEWLLASSILLFDVTVFLGLMCVPSTILSELFPANVKCIAACLASVVGAIFAFADTKSYQPLVGLIGRSNVFFAHAALIVLVIPYTILFLPETKGKTLQQIQDDLMVKAQDKKCDL